MNEARCIGEPVSWLRLERYLLGELATAESAPVAAHLRACPACAAAEREAQQPLALPALAKVATVATVAMMTTVAAAAAPPAPEGGRPEPSRPIAKVGGLSRLSAALFGTRPVGIVSRLALVAATGLILVVSRSPSSERRRDEPANGAGETLAGVKGGEVGVELVRERSGVIAPSATTFLESDRWKVLVTCPSGRVRFWEVVVRDGAATAFPFAFAPSSPLTCGNHVALPGALRISGPRPSEVCVVLADAPPDRTHLAALDAAGLAATGACVTLRPEAPAPP